MKEDLKFKKIFITCAKAPIAFQQDQGAIISFKNAGFGNNKTIIIVWWQLILAQQVCIVQPICCI